MTNDEMVTRVVRLETKLTALTAMVHCLLPATLPNARPLIPKQYGYWMDVMELELRSTGGTEAEVGWHMEVLKTFHKGIEDTLAKVTELEASMPEKKIDSPP